MDQTPYGEGDPSLFDLGDDADWGQLFYSSAADSAVVTGDDALDAFQQPVLTAPTVALVDLENVVGLADGATTSEAQAHQIYPLPLPADGKLNPVPQLADAELLIYNDLDIPVPLPAPAPAASTLSVAPASPTQPNPVAPSHPRHQRRFISHRREHKGSISNHPTQFYKTLSTHPRSWGFNRETGRDTFAYTEKGELEANVTYTAQQLFEYIKRPNREGSDEHLILWIQNPPSQFNHRYPRGQESGFCRWEKCPVKHNSILKGHWRVALDEKGDVLGETYDPFHNAGYLHLYCLEKMFDLIELFLDPGVDIRPDYRRMGKEERNPMALNKGSNKFTEEMAAWETEQTRKHLATPPNCRRRRTESDFLYRRLTILHLQVEAKKRGRAAITRGDLHLAKYLGDLTLYTKLKNEARKARAAGARSTSSLAPSGSVAEFIETYGGAADQGTEPRAPVQTARTTRKRGRDQADDTSAFQPGPAKIRKIVASDRHQPSRQVATAGDPFALQRVLLQPVPRARKRARQESGTVILDTIVIHPQNSPKRLKSSPASDGPATARTDVDSLHQALAQQGPVTRGQSRAMNTVLDKLSSGEMDETRNIMELIEALPRCKKIAVYDLAVKQAGHDRRLASI